MVLLAGSPNRVTNQSHAFPGHFGSPHHLYSNLSLCSGDMRAEDEDSGSMNDDVGGEDRSPATGSKDAEGRQRVAGKGEGEEVIGAKRGGYTPEMRT